MPHFYVPPENISDKTFRITGEDVHHLVTVLRYAVGDKLKLFDGQGKTMIGVIDLISKDEIKGTLLRSAAMEKPGIAVHLYQAVPKGERFDWFVEKAAELGVAKVTPLITARSVITEVAEQKLERWRRLGKAACQQCGRAGLMEIEKPVEFSPLLGRGPMPVAALNIIAWESESSKTLKEAFEERKVVKEANIFIGPEGGFSVKEIELAKASGLIPVTLGTRILRSETAGLLSTILALNLAGEYGNDLNRNS